MINATASGPGKEENMECQWIREVPGLDGPWETSCGYYFDFDDPDDGPDNIFRFCPYCGKKIATNK